MSLGVKCAGIEAAAWRWCFALIVGARQVGVGAGLGGMREVVTGCRIGVDGGEEWVWSCSGPSHSLEGRLIACVRIRDYNYSMLGSSRRMHVQRYKEASMLRARLMRLTHVVLVKQLLFRAEGELKQIWNMIGVRHPGAPCLFEQYPSIALRRLFPFLHTQTPEVYLKQIHKLVFVSVKTLEYLYGGARTTSSNFRAN